MIFEVGDYVIVRRNAIGFPGRQKKIVGEIIKIGHKTKFLLRKSITYYKIKVIGIDGEFIIEPRFIVRAAIPNEVEQKNLHHFLDKL
jgi:hypothetical protein